MKSKKRPKSKKGNLQHPAKNRARKNMKKAAAPRRPAVKRSSAKKRKSQSRSSARSYTTATIKELFALCSNQCAFPDCPNVIVTPGTKVSKAAVLGHICHIYAASDNGPRGKPGLTKKERNGPGNLILMCGHHHPLVDKQWETYPAVQLKQWKQAHEAKAMPGTAEAIKRTVDIEKHVFFEQVSDEQIEKALARIRRGRFLVGFPTVEETQRLATQVEQSRYSSGSALQRARALAWCARLLAQDATMARATALLRESTEIQMTPEGSLAEAFIKAATDPRAALASLAIINTPAARSAALRIVTTKNGVKGALAWAEVTGLSIDRCDAEGKFTLIINALVDAEWSRARKAVNGVADNDFDECPALLYPVAMAHLLTAVPDDLRTVAFNQVPFEASTFPLASTPESLAARRAAQSLFERLAQFAREVGAAESAMMASDYALWLGLRDPDGHDAAMVELRDSMSDPAKSIRRVNFAIRFGLKVDLAAIEARLDQNLALSGMGTAEDALARFALAFTKEGHRAAADYIEKHRAQLYEHLQEQLIIGFEIEVLARAGLVTTAREKLEHAVGEGFSARDQGLLNALLAEVSGSDPIAERRALYESTRDLRALINLVGALEKARLWQDMLPYAEKLFAASPSVETYERVVHCLNELGRYGDLQASMAQHPGLIDQSENLKSIWAWVLYLDGRFAQATAALQKLSDKNSPNARRLRVNVDLASGAWDRLLEYCQEIWDGRDRYSATELMHAAQISVVLNGPHSRDLVMAATEKEPTNAGILAAAYFQATSAGWEQSPAVAGWLNAAAQLSGDDGPLKAVSMQELLANRPEWDKQTEHVWDQLKKGKIPTFVAGQLLHRSVLDFYLLPSLANPSEVDVRKRSLIFAYSGARQLISLPQPRTLAVDLAAIVTLAQLGLLDKVLSRYQIIVPHTTLGWLFQERQKATFHQPSRIQNATEIKQFIANQTLTVFRPPASQDHKLTRQVGADLAALLSAARDQSSAGKKTLVVRSSPLPRLGSVLTEEADITGYEGCICSCAAVIDRLKLKGALTRPEEQRARDYLKLQERPWTNEPVIDEQTEIYLDGLSVTYLQTAGVLGKLKVANLKTYITQSEDSEANSLLDVQSFGQQQLAYIEQIRASLAAGLVSGRVKAARATQEAEDDPLPRLHPTYGVLGLVGAADALVVDDRFINQHLTMAGETGTVPVLCSLDVLDLLQTAGELTVEERLAHRTVLRQAGYQLIAVAEDELIHHVKQAPVVGGELIETAELKAIRESLLRARMSALVQLPVESSFLHGTLSAFVSAIREVWQSLPDRAEAAARANYLLSQFDVRKWASTSSPGTEREFVLYTYAAFVLQLTTPPVIGDKSLKDAYFAWITDALLKPVKDNQPDVYEWVMARSRELLIQRVDEAAREYAGQQ